MSEKKRDISQKSVNTKNYQSRQGTFYHSAKYNNITMLEQTAMSKEGFVKRLAELRTKKGISARDMSLSMGMAPNYINSIENEETLPSMSMFYEICQFLRVTPKEFFSYTANNTRRDHELIAIIDWLDDDSVELLLTIAKLIKQNGGL